MSGRDETTHMMQAIAKGVDRILNGEDQPKRNAFVLLVMPFNGPPGARTNYVSNADRDDIVAMMKEVVDRFEKQKELS